MRKVYKYKKGSCGLCHPHKKKWAKKSEGKKQELQAIEQLKESAREFMEKNAEAFRMLAEED